MTSSSHGDYESGWQPASRAASRLGHAGSDNPAGSSRLWMGIVLGLCLLCVAGILGGYAFGAKIMQGTHLREQFATGQDVGAQPLALGASEQSRKLTGNQQSGVHYYSGPSELAAAAARGEVVIDNQGVIHEVSLETPLAEPGTPELDVLLQASVPDTLPPMPKPLPDFGSERLAHASVPSPLSVSDSGPGRGLASASGGRRSASPDDVFFGQ